MIVKHFRDLRVYQEAFKTAMEIYRLSKSWPRDEKFSLTDQIRRSSRAVCENIAEAWRKRRYEAHFISKISDADSEAAETQSWLDFAKACEYMSAMDYQKLDEFYERISGGLVKMMDNPEKWCSINHEVAEEQETYGS